MTSPVTAPARAAKAQRLGSEAAGEAEPSALVEADGEASPEAEASGDIDAAADSAGDAAADPAGDAAPVVADGAVSPPPPHAARIGTRSAIKSNHAKLRRWTIYAPLPPLTSTPPWDNLTALTTMSASTAGDAGALWVALL